MPITEIRIEAVEPFAEGHAFGDVGPYVRIRGVAHGELDPDRAGKRRHRRSRQGAAQRARARRVRDRFLHPAPGRAARAAAASSSMT